MNDELKTSAIKATVAYLRARGWDVLGTMWEEGDAGIDVIAKDGEELVFVRVSCSGDIGSGLPKEDLGVSARAEAERAAARFLSTYQECNIEVRFDDIGILILSDDRALVRHHVNAFGLALPGGAI